MVTLEMMIMIRGMIRMIIATKEGKKENEYIRYKSDNERGVSSLDFFFFHVLWHKSDFFFICFIA